MSNMFEPFHLILSSSSESESEDKESKDAVLNKKEGSTSSENVDEEAEPSSISHESDASFIPVPSPVMYAEESGRQEPKTLKRRRNDLSSSSCSNKSSTPSVSEQNNDNVFAQLMIPKGLQSVVDMKAMQDLVDENNKGRRRIDEQLYRWETTIIEDAFKIKKFAADLNKPKPRGKKRIAAQVEEPLPVITEKDRIFSGTSASFQPRNIFDSDDDDDIK